MDGQAIRRGRHVLESACLPNPARNSSRRGEARFGLAKALPIERTWVPDREAMLAALRAVLDLPAQLPSPAGGGER